MITLASFDIGIKNMAVCILQIENVKSIHEIIEFKDKDNDTFQKIDALKENETSNVLNNGLHILHWEIMDITKEENERQKDRCQCLLKCKKKICNKIGIYEKNSVFFCEKHAKSQTRWIVPTKQLQRSSLKKMKYIELEQLCSKLQTFSSSDEKLNEKKRTKEQLWNCVLELLHEHCLNTIKINKPEKTNTIDLITLGRIMTRKLDAIKDIHTITHIIIENQISPIASRMKTLQGMLAQYFIMKSENTTIAFVSSCNKLKLFHATKLKEIQNTNEISPKIESTKRKRTIEKDDIMKTKKKEIYKDHKKDAIKHTLEIIEKNQIPWLHHIETSKKKDDLADSFLQGISYLHRTGILTIHQYVIEISSEVDFGF